MSFLGPDTVIPDLYATPTDYFNWTQTEGPASLLATLRACTALVVDATASAFYGINPTTGLPTEQRLVNALRDATCIQAAAWVALKVDPSLGGVRTAAAGTATTRKIGSATITRSEQDVAAVAEAAAAARVELVPDAVTLLARHGLITNTVWTFG